MLTPPIFYIHVFTIMNHCLRVSYLRQFRPWIEVLWPRDRATGDPSDAHTSNFLHPCFYYYESLPTGELSALFTRVPVLGVPVYMYKGLKKIYQGRKI